MTKLWDVTAESGIIVPDCGISSENLTIDTTHVKSGTKALKFDGVMGAYAGWGQGGALDLPGLSELWVEADWWMSSLPVARYAPLWFTHGGWKQCHVSLEPDGKWSLYPGDNNRANAVGYWARSINTFSKAGDWAHLSIYYKVADSGGRFRLSIDGTSFIDFAGDTSDLSTLAVAHVHYGALTNRDNYQAEVAWFDNIRIYDANPLVAKVAFKARIW